MTKNQAIRDYIVQRFIANGGKHLFISDVAADLKTNAVTVRKACDEQLNGFDYFEADRWSGSSFSGRYIQSWCVEPSKKNLVSLISSELRETLELVSNRAVMPMSLINRVKETISKVTA